MDVVPIISEKVLTELIPISLGVKDSSSVFIFELERSIVEGKPCQSNSPNRLVPFDLRKSLVGRLIVWFDVVTIRCPNSDAGCPVVVEARIHRELWTVNSAILIERMHEACCRPLLVTRLRQSKSNHATEVSLIDSTTDAIYVSYQEELEVLNFDDITTLILQPNEVSAPVPSETKLSQCQLLRFIRLGNIAESVGFAGVENTDSMAFCAAVVACLLCYRNEGRTCVDHKSAA